MVINAMWYKTDEGGTNSGTIQLGPISLSTHELYTSTMSSLILVPPILLISLLFGKSGLSKKERESGHFGLQTGKKKLPYWCQYIAWVLTALAIAVGAFFTILYSFQFGGEKSEKWLIAFVMTFLQSVLLVQPVKVRRYVTYVCCLYSE
jgi:polycystin 1L2